MLKNGLIIEDNYIFNTKNVTVYERSKMSRKSWIAIRTAYANTEAAVKLIPQYVKEKYIILISRDLVIIA